MLSFYQQFAKWLKQEPVILATVVQVKGSAPREVGAKMAIRSDGGILGTIGGGAGEAKVIQQALQTLATGNKQWVEIDLSGAAQRETQGVCGGTMRVWLERWQGSRAIALTEQILELLKAGKSGTLTTPFTQEQPPYLELSPSPFPFSLTSTHFSEALSPPPTLLIVGAGHCAIPLTTIAHLAGFRVVVQDDRPEFACTERFPNAAVVYPQPIAEVIKQLTHIAELYVALVTRGYLHDLAALKALSQRSLHYLGMIGSEKRVKTVYQALQKEEIAIQTKNIYAPIGLDIGALTPEEIAVSICAELIQVRRGGTGLSLSTRMQKTI
jgi:xanthine dehydrogenase accessory factor